MESVTPALAPIWQSRHFHFIWSTADYRFCRKLMKYVKINVAKNKHHKKRKAEEMRNASGHREPSIGEPDSLRSPPGVPRQTNSPSPGVGKGRKNNKRGNRSDKAKEERNIKRAETQRANRGWFRRFKALFKTTPGNFASMASSLSSFQIAQEVGNHTGTKQRNKHFKYF